MLRDEPQYPVALRGPAADAFFAFITAGFGIGSVLSDLLLLLWEPRFALRVAALMLVGSSFQLAVPGVRRLPRAAPV